MQIPDIVYFIGDTLPDNGVEFKFSLRSLRNLPHGRVWVMSPTLPEWIQDIDWIEWTQQTEKQFDISEKYKALIRIKEDMTDNVIVMDDDFYITKATSNMPLLFNTSLEAMCGIQDNNYAKNAHGYALHNSFRLLREQELGWPLGASLHVPYPITRSEMPVHLEDGKGPYEWKSIWLNWATVKLGKKAELINGDAKVSTKKGLAPALKSMGFLSSLESEMDKAGIAMFLETEFPDPSPYERIK